jgi:WD40 repeat protein
MTDIFLSYAREDRRHAQRLARALEATHGWSVWWDPRLRAGERFPREIQTAIADARCVVVLWSRDAVESSWVAAEAAEGWERGVLVPVVLDDCEPPMPFRQTQGADFAGWTGSESSPAFLSLVQDLERVMARGSAVSPIELGEREGRRRRVVRQRLLRRVGAAASLVCLPLLAAGVWRWQSQRQFAETLAGRADQLRADLFATAEARNTLRSAFLFDHRANLDEVERSALLAVEAVKRASTPVTRRALLDAWAELPWSDQAHEIDFDDNVSWLAFTYDGSYLVAGGGCGGTQVWDIVSDRIAAQVDYGGLSAAECADPRGERWRRARPFVTSPREDIFATGGPDATVRIWSPSGEALNRLEVGGAVTTLAFARDGGLLVVAALGRGVSVWDVATARELQQIRDAGDVYALEVAPSGDLVATVDRDDAVRVWSVADGRELRRIALPPHRLGGRLGLEFNSDASWLATYAADLDTTFWSVSTAEAVWQIPGGSYAGPVFSADGRTMMLDEDEALSWWDVASRERLMSQQVGVVIDLSGPVAGRVAAVVDSSVRVFDVASGRELKHMPYFRSPVAGALSPGGDRLGTVGEDYASSTRLLELTRLDPDHPADAVCRQVGRNLSVEEWRTYLGGAPYRATCDAIDASSEDPL